MVEHSAVNRRVASSNLARGAILPLESESLTKHVTITHFGCNFVFFGWKFKANAYLFRDLLTKRHILLQLAIQVSDALVCVAESETNQVFWCVLLPQPSRAEPPKCVSTRFRLPQLLEKLMQGNP